MRTVFRSRWSSALRRGALKIRADEPASGVENERMRLPSENRYQ